MSRPKKDFKGETKSVYLSRSALEIIEKKGYQSNLSAYVDALICNTDADSPVILSLEVEQLSKKLALIEEQANVVRAERDMKQARLNLSKQTASAAQAMRMKILRKWVEISLSYNETETESVFRKWISGPANVHFIRECECSNEDELVRWCKGQTMNGG